MKAPPLLVSYSSADHYLSALDPQSREQHEGEIRALVSNGLPPVVSSRCLATLFGFSTKFINAMNHQSWKYYRTFKIQQRKKKRIIQSPKVSIKVIQKWFGHHLAKAIKFNELVFGFIEGKSAIDAASIHTNAKWIYSIDIKDFFSSTTSDVIKSGLREIGYSEKACNLIIPLCCYKEKLAQGAPSSPVLSNIAMKNIDSKLILTAQKYNVRFTRYVDDIVFSSQESIFDPKLKDDIANIFKNTCWELSKEKEYFAEHPKRLKVHGLLVHQENPRLTKGYRNKIRAFKHMINSGKAHEKDINRLIGHIKYAQAVDKYQK